jgi:RHS repeat-associated protein
MKANATANAPGQVSGAIAESGAGITTSVSNIRLEVDTAPVISNVTTGGITATSATITWNTNENSDSQVEYGTTTAYGQSTTLDPAIVSAHSQGLSGLASGTLYHYRVRSRDATGNLAVSGDFSFTTAPDTTPPTVTSYSPAAGATNVNANANVTVTFSEAMNAATVNGATLELRDPSNTLVSATVSYNAASLTATLDPTASLTTGVTYTARVRGGGTDPRVKDVAGNALATDVTWTFTTAQNGSGGIKWLVTDHLGSTRMVIDETGNLGGINRHDFAPFGEELSAGAGIRSASNGYSGGSVRQKFGSKERDIETGLDYFLARYYSSTQGRFTSPDPIFISDWQTANPQLWNLYNYVGNNPLAYVDPTGMELVRLGQHTDEEIKRRQKEIDQQLKALKNDKNLTKDQRKEQEKALKAEKNTLSLEMEGNKVGRQLIADLNARGEGNGLQLSNLTLTTDPKKDFMSDPNFVKGAGSTKRAQEISNSNAKSGMFVLLGYSTQIYLNATSNDYAGYKSGDADYVTYGGTALRHEQFHLQSPDKSEHSAYSAQLRILQKYGPAAFKSREFYDRAIDHITAGSKRKD